jgi:TonB family protein
LPSKSKSPNADWKDPWVVSYAFHGLLAALILVTLFRPNFHPQNDVEIEILESPKLATQPIQAVVPKAPPKKSRGHEVFGMSRKTQTSDQGEAIKAGNTLAKTPDQEKLRPEDQDTLPIPSEDYLITKMPVLQTNVRIPYPPVSKKAGIQGSAIMNLLIDATGRVREVVLVEAPNPELGAAALQAAKGFQFSPAFIEAKAVAIRIRYAYRFVLER